MINKAIKKINSITLEIQRTGWIWTIGHRVLKLLKIEEIKINVRALKEPVYIRVIGSDIYEFKQSLGSKQAKLDLGVTPKTIIDAGANVGYASLRFIQKFPDVKIIAVEPENTNIKQFNKNCSKYSNIYLEQSAIWPRNANLSFKLPDAVSNAFQVSEDPAGLIKGISVEELMKKYNLLSIDLMKIDIEGSEKFLFSDPNAEKWLSKVNALLIEVHDESHGVPGCVEAVKQATSQLFYFKGYINEYEYYTRK